MAQLRLLYAGSLAFKVAMLARPVPSRLPARPAQERPLPERPLPEHPPQERAERQPALPELVLQALLGRRRGARVLAERAEARRVMVAAPRARAVAAAVAKRREIARPALCLLSLHSRMGNR